MQRVKAAMPELATDKATRWADGPPGFSFST